MQLALRDVLKIFQVPEKTVTAWIEKKKMPCVRVNERYRFNTIELLEWALESRIPLTLQILDLAQEGSADSNILSAALTNGKIYYDVPGETRETVLKSVVDLLPLPTGTDRAALLQLFLARELMESTAVGNGIALPHIRNPVVLNIEKPCVTLCFLRRAVDFRALDQKPVSIVFALLSPSVKMHLAILARLAFCLHNERLQKFLDNRARAEEILAEFMILESRLAAAPENKK